jgi:ferredoxin
MPYVIKNNCTKCGACLPECPTGSISEGKDQYVIDTDTCADHAMCASVCPVEAIERQKGHASNSDDSDED